MRTRLARHEAELERARQQQHMRDSLASAIMHTAANDNERGDSVHFWQNRKLRWKSSLPDGITDGEVRGRRDANTRARSPAAPIADHEVPRVLPTAGESVGGTCALAGAF